MAYSDYGGYAYRNNERVTNRSDCVFDPNGEIKSTPGQWPGWTLPEGRNGGSYHAVLGDDPFYITLYKQSSLAIYHKGELVDHTSMIKKVRPEIIESYEYEGKTEEYIDYDKCDEEILSIEVDGYKVERHWKSISI